MLIELRSLARLVFLGLILSGAQVASVGATTCEGPRYSRFDAWVGEWQILEGGELVATNELRPILGGCAFEEKRARVDGLEERGLIYFDHEADQWRGRWVISDGTTAEFGFDFDGDETTTDGMIHDPTGAPLWMRGRLSPLPDGGFLNVVEISSDGESYQSAGATTFLPAGAAGRIAQALPSPEPETERQPEPMPAPEPTTPEAPMTPEASEPAPMPEPQGQDADGPTILTLPVPEGVTLKSKRKSRQTQTIAMESPMMLELEFGRLDELPEGTAWLSTKLAPYRAETISVRRVTAEMKTRRGKVTLELTLNLHSIGFQSRIDLKVELISQGEVVGEVTKEKIPMGKMISAHDKDEGMPFPVRFELDEQSFAELFEDGRRPSMRLTLGVR